MLRRSLPPEKRLRALKVKDPTLLRYDDAVFEFQKWATLNKVSILSPLLIDKAMCRYFCALKDDSRPLSDATYTVYGWILLKSQCNVPEKQQLSLAKGAIAGWQSRCPGGTRTGADPALLHLFAEEFIALGRTDAAGCLELQLDGYLRPSEAVVARGRDFFPPSASTASPWGMVVGNSEFGETTKSKKQDDTILFDSADRTFLPRILKRITAGKLSLDVPIFPCLTLSVYEELFRKVGKSLGIASLRVTPHTVRHSGPSWDRLHNLRNDSQIQDRGRWACSRSVLRYKKPGRLLLAMSSLPESVRKRMPVALSHVLTHF